MDRNHFDEKIYEFLFKAENSIPNKVLPDLPLISPGVYDWYDFEHQLWKIGEEMRMFLDMNEQDKEAVMYYLSGAGLQEFVPSMTDGKITVTFTPNIQRVLGCTMFSLLNRLEKLDGAFNVIFPKATLELRVPLGAKKGMVKCEMLIMQLYRWLFITETSTNTVSNTLNVQSQVEPNASATEQKSAESKPEKKGFFAKLFGKK